MIMKAFMKPFKKGMIIIWSGSLATIPKGWQHCDGTNGTPDLRAVFLRGASGEGSIGLSGGSDTHDHTFTGDGHNHSLPAGTGLDGGAIRSTATDSSNVTGITDTGDSKPPYFNYAYIIKM